MYIKEDLHTFIPTNCQSHPQFHSVQHILLYCSANANTREEKFDEINALYDLYDIPFININIDDPPIDNEPNPTFGEDSRHYLHLNSLDSLRMRLLLFPPKKVSNVHALQILRCTIQIFLSYQEAASV